MKTNNSSILFFLILVISTALVNGQTDTITDTATSSTTSAAAPATTNGNSIDKCLKDNNCGTDQACRAKCAKVPDPSASDVDATNQCVAKCDQKAAPDVYKACVNNCYQIYFPNSTAVSPSGTTPASGVNSVNTASSSATGSGSDAGASGSPSPKSAAVSLRQENLYPLMLLLISVVAGMSGFFFEII
ncbi:4988_t:CDS:2 [Acaulospora morrowiae]|uniref:4988_t:CDS:1 n=1 Tax=Acaulospora morrowiae TaxID=94023 RepID=A0A9N8VYQ2_9GLOM|nr:4988_t:CDS:2 [Acaulospora morrowiae]